LGAIYCDSVRLACFGNWPRDPIIGSRIWAQVRSAAPSATPLQSGKTLRF